MEISGILALLNDHEEVVTSHARWAEERGCIHPEVLNSLVSIGVPRFFLPGSLGGFELSPLDCAEVTEAIADIDPSAAWFVMVFNASRLAGATWDKDLVDLVWGDNPDILVAASGNSPYEGEKQGSFVHVEGTNHFASGCRYAKWMLSPIRIGGAVHSVVLPMSDCKILDNWDSLGMRGSGSNSVKASGVRVPISQVIPASPRKLIRNHYYQGVLYQAPARIVFTTYVPIALSLAKKALKILSDLAENKFPSASNVKLKYRASAQAQYGKGLAIYRSARGFFHDQIEKAWVATQRGIHYDAKAKAELYLSGTHAVQESARVVRLVADAAGTAATNKTNPLERISRDIETLRHHGFINESRYASVAQVLWQSDLDYPLVLR